MIKENTNVQKGCVFMCESIRKFSASCLSGKCEGLLSVDARGSFITGGKFILSGTD
jgi:hypothetical protein